MDWVFVLFRTYWPALLILMGLGYLIYGIVEEEIAVGIICMVLFGGAGILFFLYTPSEVWAWLSEIDVVRFLFTGVWYEIALKVTGAIGAIGLILKVVIGALREE